MERRFVEKVEMGKGSIMEGNGKEDSVYNGGGKERRDERILEGSGMEDNGEEDR